MKFQRNSYDEVLYSPTDFQKLNEIDGGIIEQDKKEEMEEFKANELLGDPNLIYTLFGQGRDQKFFSVENEENNYYIGNTAYDEMAISKT